MNYGCKNRGGDRSSDGSESSQMKIAEASQVRYVFSEREGGIKCDAQVTDISRVCIRRKSLSQ